MLTQEFSDKNHSDPDGLPEPFDRLVDEHVISMQQARLVLDALSQQPAAQTEPQLRPALVTRLAEVGAYLGAALVLAAGAVVVGQQWADMTYAMRVGVVGVTTVVLLAAAFGVLVMHGGRPWAKDSQGQTLRRLCGTLFTAAAGAAFGTVMVALLSDQVHVGHTEAGRAVMLASATACAVLVVGLVLAGTALGEFGLFGSVVGIVAGLLVLTSRDDESTIVLVQWCLVAVGVAWAIMATYTNLLRNKNLGSALGLALAVSGGSIKGEDAWSQRLALLALVAISLAVYLTRPTWPYIAAAIVAAVLLIVTWVGQAVGAAVALLAAGVVVLVFAGGALALRQRRRVVPVEKNGA